MDTREICLLGKRLSSYIFNENYYLQNERIPHEAPFPSGIPTAQMRILLLQPAEGEPLPPYTATWSVRTKHTCKVTIWFSAVASVRTNLKQVIWSFLHAEGRIEELGQGIDKAYMHLYANTIMKTMNDRQRELAWNTFFVPNGPIFLC